MNTLKPQTWNPELYQTCHSFVWEYGRDLLGLLAPQKHESILDVGCGTGNLTAEIAALSGKVTGVDSSQQMIDRARLNYPHLDFRLAEVQKLTFEAEYDAIFSNAVLHWVRDAEPAAQAMSHALKPAGRMVVEFGGKGNIAAVLEATYRALELVGVDSPELLNCWYFPSVDEYTSVLEGAGMRVSYAALFDRPTVLDGGLVGMTNWIRVFGGMFLSAVSPEKHETFFEKLNEYAAPSLLCDGVWQADYRRLRVAAIKR
jgi:trans-aconitate methyltransferase